MNNFGTQSIAVGKPANFNTGTNWEYLQISNESGYQLDLNFSGIGSMGFNPWQRDDIAVSKQYTGTLVITASNPGNADITKFPTTYVQVNGYIPGELAQPMSVALTRLANVGNPVSTSVTSTNAISNTGNAPLSNWLAVMPNDALANTFTADTSGNLTVKSDNAGVLSTLIQLVAGASPAVKLAAAAIITEILGELLVDGNFLVTNGLLGTAAAGDIIDASGADTSLKVRGASNAIHLESPAGTDVAQFAFNQITFNQGLKMAGGHIIQFNIGQIKDLNTGNGASGTINHGLTGTPAAVLCTCDTAASSATVGAYSYTTTQFGMTIGGALDGRWVAYR